MARHQKIKYCNGNCFYSAPLLYGKTNLRPYRDFYCYFIAEHTHDPEYIRQQMIQLLMSQCYGFDFFGVHSKVWAQELYTADRMIYSSTEQRYYLNQWDHINDFVGALRGILSCHPLVPHDVYLIYDDAEIYQKVLDMLGCKEGK